MTVDYDAALILGRHLRATRHSLSRSQSSVGRQAGVSQSLVSKMELGSGGNIDLDVWDAVASAVGLRLELRGGDPRGARLACHRMVSELACVGGWAAHMTHDEAILTRGDDRAVLHVWDTVTSVTPDVERFRESLGRERGNAPRVSGIVVIPATGANRRRVSEQRDDLRDHFHARANAWYAALVNARRPMPSDPGILWAFPDCRGLRPATVRPGWIWTAVGGAPRFVTGRRD